MSLSAQHDFAFHKVHVSYVHRCEICLEFIMVCACARDIFLTNNSVRNNKGLCSYVKYISVVTVPLLLVPCFLLVILIMH